MGIPDDVVARTLGAAGPVDFEVWPVNWPVIEAWAAICTQWSIATIGGGMAPGRLYWAGLDYARVAAGLAGMGIAAPPEVWRGLRTMEAAARDVLNGIGDGG